MASTLKLFAFTVLACMIVAAPTATYAAISCGTVSSKLAPCIPYLTSRVSQVSPPCCSGVRSLNSLAQTTPDRQQACRCLQSAASSIGGLKPNLAASLPRACNVKISYPISLGTNCDSIK